MTALKDFLHEALIQNQKILPLETEEKLAAYLELLQKWNRVHNLTAIRDLKESVLLHIVDSLSIKPWLHGTRLIDVGTGAGLPGIPLALACPDKKMVLLDSNSKKTRFLSQVMYTLSIKNIEIVHARVEDFNPVEKFDSILSRAFANLSEMIRATQHLLAENGQMLAMKGVYPEQELRAIPPPFTATVHELEIGGLDAKRHLVCLTKGVTLG